ncbi:MAG: hypothetical protein F6K26_17965 [Moorea sp. SIO2I5]|nr:hypothetical protein [Moorena sp. SIO2I5]
MARLREWPGYANSFQLLNKTSKLWSLATLRERLISVTSTDELFPRLSILINLELLNFTVCASAHATRTRFI